MSELIFNLERIRLDIGNVQGTYADILKFKDFKGFKDTLGTDFDDTSQHTNYPALYGTYTITDDMFQDDLDELEEMFPTLTIACSGTILDFNDFAVQTIDSTKPNYNPAVGIILNNNNIGNIIPGKGWYLTKTKAATILIGQTGMFKSKTTVTDNNHIVQSGNTGDSYNFTSFNELQYFTSDSMMLNTPNSNNGYFQNCSLLEEVTLPINNKTYLGNTGCTNNHFFAHCIKLTSVNNLEYYTGIGHGTFIDCPELEHINTSNIQYIVGASNAYSTFRDCYKLHNIDLTSLIEVSYPRGSATNRVFMNMNPNYIHLGNVPPILPLGEFIYNVSTIFYVGDGSSLEHDTAVLEGGTYDGIEYTGYKNANIWSGYYNQGIIKTWWEHENS